MYGGIFILLIYDLYEYDMTRIAGQAVLKWLSTIRGILWLWFYKHHTKFVLFFQSLVYWMEFFINPFLNTMLVHKFCIYHARFYEEYKLHKIQPKNDGKHFCITGFTGLAPIENLWLMNHIQ